MMYQCLMVCCLMVVGVSVVVNAWPGDVSLPEVDPVVQGYYKGVDLTAKDDALTGPLGKLLYNHKQLSYDDLWNAFDVIDLHMKGCNTSDTIGDMYSANCWIPGKQQCGNYRKEGDCYNREHGWPKSWWGGFSQGHGAQTDLFHIFPVDGYVNNIRGNYPLGTVSKPSYTSTSNAKFGPCTSPGYNGECFEIPDNYKGDFARAYFYVSVTYKGKFTCCNDQGVDGASIKPWMEQQLREWHKADPVSPRETHYNDLVFHNFQNNRNPFIDFPGLVDQISDF